MDSSWKQIVKIDAAFGGYSLIIIFYVYIFLPNCRKGLNKLENVGKGNIGSIGNSL